jgi:ankyrin repeat protein
LFIAAQNGHLDVVRHLVEVGADKDQAQNQGATPLFIAAQNGHLDVVRHLVEVMRCLGGFN